MKITFAGITYDCTKAVKTADSTVLSLSDGGQIEFSGVSDFTGFQLDGGAWDAPAPAPEEQRLNDLETAVATLIYGGGTV